MQLAPIYILECGMSERVDNCFDDYVTDLLRRYVIRRGEQDGFDAFAEHHRHSLGRIQKRFGRENYTQALALLNQALDKHRQHDDTSAYRPFIQMLLSDYYDPMYDYQLSKKTARIVFKGTAAEILERLDDASSVDSR